VLARRRARMGVVIGALLAANAVLLALFLSVGALSWINKLEGTVFGPASRVFYDTLLAYLERGQDVLLGVGLVLVLAGCFAGENKYGTAVRTTVASGLESIGSRAGGGQVRSTGRWVAANRAWLRVAAVILGLVVLLWGNEVSLERLWWSLATVVVGLAVVQILIGAGGDAPDGEPIPPLSAPVEGT